MYSYGPSHMAVQKQDDQLELTYSNYVGTQDVTLKIYRRQWMIGRSREIGSGISVLAAQHDDDDDDDIYIIGVTQTNRAGLGSTSKKCSPEWTQKEKETWWVKKSGCLRKSKEKPVLLLRPNNVLEQNGMILNQFNLSWKSLIAMEPLAISFLLRSILWSLINMPNLKLWGYTNSDLYLSCKSDRSTLCHVLSACPPSLQIYTWWHNKVLEVIIELLRAQCETANQQSITAKKPIIQFLKEGECPVRKHKKS